MCSKMTYWSHNAVVIKIEIQDSNIFMHAMRLGPMYDGFKFALIVKPAVVMKKGECSFVFGTT